MKTFDGKTAAITGAASGIGLGMARAFGARGARIAAMDIEPGALESAIEALRSEGVEAEGFAVDVTDRDRMHAVADEIEQRFGPTHILCNNAGVGVADPLQVARAEDWDWVTSVNLAGVVNGLLAFLPRMTAHGEAGHVVNTASVAGLFAMRDIGIYNTTKYAVVGMSETLRDDLANENIGVSVLCPGFVNTNINQSRRNRQARFGKSRRPQMSGEAMRAIDRALKTRGLEPIKVGEMVVDAIERGIFYIVTDPAFWLPVRRRFEAIATDVRALHDGLPGSE